MSVSASRGWQVWQESSVQGLDFTNSSTAGTPLALGVNFGNGVNNIAFDSGFAPSPSIVYLSGYVEVEIDVLSASAGGEFLLYWDPNGGTPGAGSSPTGSQISGLGAFYGTGQSTYKIWLGYIQGPGTLQLVSESSTASSSVNISAVRIRVVRVIENKQP
ncbi:MAG: hypothetical protein QW429_04010 [Thermoprotei archaeon]